MESELRRILRGHSQALSDELTARLSRGPGLHYAKTDRRVLSERCRLLVEALVSSTFQGAEQLGEFVAGVASRRFAEGFELAELQRALRILEVLVWQVVVRESTPRSLATNLAALNTTMGYARDELARVCQIHTFATAS
jgi:hypothetical protein